MDWKLIWDGIKLCYTNDTAKYKEEPNCFLRISSKSSGSKSSGNASSTGGLFKGTSAGKYKIGMSLDVASDKRTTSGSYHYLSKMKPISLSGTVDATSRLVLTEVVDDRVTGTFNGVLSATGFSGNWFNGEGTK